MGNKYSRSRRYSGAARHPEQKQKEKVVRKGPVLGEEFFYGYLFEWKKVRGEHHFESVPTEIVLQADHSACDLSCVCMWELSVANNTKENCIVLVKYYQNRNGGIHHTSKHINYAGLKSMENYMKIGYEFRDTVLHTQGSTTVVCLYCAAVSASLVLVCIDVEELTILGSTSHGEFCKDAVCRISPDESVMAVLEKYSSQDISVYSVCECNFLYNVPVNRLGCSMAYLSGLLPGCLAFDPKYGAEKLTYCDKMTITVTSLKSKSVLQQTGLRNIDGYPTPCYSPDGQYLFICVSRYHEPRERRVNSLDIGPSYRSSILILDPDTLEFLHTLHHETRATKKCLSVPMFSRCSTRVALLSTEVTKKVVYVYALPLNRRSQKLQEICRTKILQQVKSTKSLHKLPLPKKLIQYLNYVPC